MLFDLFPTIADLTRTSLPDGVEGHDLAEIWRGSSTETRDVLYTVYEDLQRSVRDERWKLIRYPKIDRMQLFDLQNDPFEMNDLAGDSAYSDQVSRLMALMQTQHADMDDPHPLWVDSLVSMEFDHTSFERRPDRHQPQWVIDKYFQE